MMASLLPAITSLRLPEFGASSTHVHAALTISDFTPDAEIGHDT